MSLEPDRSATAASDGEPSEPSGEHEETSPMKDPRDIILAPVVSEKSYALMETGVYTFKVHPSATSRRSATPSRRSGASRCAGEHPQPQGQEARRTRGTNRIGRPPTQAGHRHPGSGRDPAVRELRTHHGHSLTQAHQPGRRFQTSSDFSRDHQDDAGEVAARAEAEDRGRNSYGRKTSRHRGGGHKQQYRLVDFKRDKDGVPAKVAAIEYDPNRTCRIALLHYADGEKAYILAPRG
jgi:hypothetical protein